VLEMPAFLWEGGPQLTPILVVPSLFRKGKPLPSESFLFDSLAHRRSRFFWGLLTGHNSLGLTVVY
jgi:hypothetical protein